MVRSELVAALARDNPELSARVVETIVEAVFEAIGAQLAAGGRVELRGFGMFSTRSHDARTGRNPRTGAAVEVKSKRAVYFRPGKHVAALIDR